MAQISRKERKVVHERGRRDQQIEIRDKAAFSPKPRSQRGEFHHDRVIRIDDREFGKEQPQ
jgi:hypothetical protein